MKRIPTHWRLRPAQPQQAAAFADKTGLSPLTAQILLHRGVCDPDTARAFLKPGLNDLCDPWTLPDAERAANRIQQAVSTGERIVIYGDYDVDGISATALLIKCLRLLGAQADYYVPDRLEEGYGLNLDAVRRIAAQGTKLLITADCGMTATDEVRLARESGMDVIVTDHHEAGRNWPELRENAHSVVSAMREDSRYPFAGLSGVGVAFKLAWALGKTISGGERCSAQFQDFLLDALALVALGTIADVVPLLGENRALASYGLGGLSLASSPGLRELRRSAAVDGKQLDAWDVAFKLAPRLNAAGRLGTARRAVELLITESDETAREIADFLNTENARRQRIQQEILGQALAMVSEGPAVEDQSALVLASEGWHAGVVGVVAAKLVEAFYRPAVVLAVEAGEAHGSARSVEGVHLFQTLTECKALLTRYGGHALAAGLRLPSEHVDRFRQCFTAAVSARLPAEARTPVLDVDLVADLSALTPALLHELQQLEPYGQHNPKPVFAATDLRVAGPVQRMGATGSHMSFYARQGDVVLRAVAFGMGELAPSLEAAGACDIAFTLKEDAYRGVRRIELRAEDIRPATEPSRLRPST